MFFSVPFTGRDDVLIFFIDDKIVGYSVGYAWFEIIQLCKFTP